DNDLAGLFDRELHHRVREDGEAFVQLAPHRRGACRLRFLEPEQITEPARPRPLEDWLQIGGEFVSSWSFGVHTRADDPTDPLGYHVVHDNQGRDWSYLPATEVEHIKRNVPRNAKRGVSDLLAIQGDLEREARLRRNTAEGAALQAAIAWILQPSSRESLGGGLPAAEMPRTVIGPQVNGTRYEPVKRYPPGTILRPSAGLEYKPGPLGAERMPHFLQVMQALLRSIGLRWNMPEYLISGDASNASYASTLVAEAPFVKAREADQQFYRRHVQSLLWKALRLAWQAGLEQPPHRDWPQLLRGLDVQVELPAVASRDPLALAQTQALQLAAGWLSKRTAAAQAGLDYELEQRQLAQERAGAATAAEAQPAGPEQWLHPATTTEQAGPATNSADPASGTGVTRETSQASQTSQTSETSETSETHERPPGTG
ncbi:MAG: phage portal protein, partial [Planctomycetaceae bacterium]